MASATTGMTLEQQIGQLFMAGFLEPTPTQEMIDLIQRYHVGGVILFSRNIQNTRQVKDLTQTLQETARAAGHRFPLLISIDQENGMVQRLGPDATRFPGNMALGAIGSEEITYDVAEYTAEQLWELGINMNLAPVADVNNNPANPVVGIRSFGEDPQQVARLVAAAVHGYRADRLENRRDYRFPGVIPTLKHFPGHGDTATDSHLSLPVVPHTRERLAQIELVPFNRGIQAGAECVMTAHVALPAITGDNTPATISPAVIRGLLREELGFQGVVMTDCLEMQAISEGVGVGPGAVLALKAGVDLVLISHRYDRQRAGLELALAAVKAGEISEAEISQAAERVLRLKQQHLSWGEPEIPEHMLWTGSVTRSQVSQRAYELSTTLVRNEEELIPLRLQPEARLLVISQQQHESFSQAEDNNYPEGFLAETIRQRHSNVDEITLPARPAEDDYQKVLQAATASDISILLTMDAYTNDSQRILMQRLAQSGRPVIDIAVHNPYDLLACPQLRTYLVTYEYTRPALTAAARVLFGDIEPKGHLPVSLPGIA
jgi:beta-N-acetylhexosaminidase